MGFENVGETVFRRKKLKRGQIEQKPPIPDEPFSVRVGGGGYGHGGARVQHLHARAGIYGSDNNRWGEENKHSHLPGMDFKIEAYRWVTIPETVFLSSFPNEERFFKERGIEPAFAWSENGQCYVTRNMETKEPLLQILLEQDGYNIYDYIKQERSGNHWFPYQVAGEAEETGKIESSFEIRFEATINYHSVYADIPIYYSRLPELVKELEVFFDKAARAYDVLKPHYRYTNEVGERLYEDRDQSEKFQKLKAQVTQKQLKNLNRLLKRFRLSTMKTYTFWFGIKAIWEQYGFLSIIFIVLGYWNKWFGHKKAKLSK